MLIEKQKNAALFKRDKGYFKIADDLRKAILSGKVKVNTPIITERKLAELYDVNHSTARKATQLLVEEGLLEKVPGAGVFVKDHPAIKVKKVGLCVPTLSISEYSDMVEMVEEFLFENNCQFVLLRRDKEKEKAAKLQIVKKYLKISPLDALIFASSPTREEIEMLKKDYPEIKIAVIENDLSAEGIDSFYSDYETGAFFATEHLCKQGVKKILHIAGPGAGIVKVRTLGYERALRSHGMTPWTVIAETYMESGGFDAMREVIASGQCPDAIFAVNDLCAMGAIKALYYHGLKVPDDVKVIGMGNLREGSTNYPSVSTVDTKVNEMVKMALAHILKKLSGEAVEEVMSCMLPPHLIIRASSQNKNKV